MGFVAPVREVFDRAGSGRQHGQLQDASTAETGLRAEGARERSSAKASVTRGGLVGRCPAKGSLAARPEPEAIRASVEHGGVPRSRVEGVNTERRQTRHDEPGRSRSRMYDRSAQGQNPRRPGQWLLAYLSSVLGPGDL